MVNIPPAEFRQIYAVNEVAFEASLSTTQVPLSMSGMLVGLGLLLMGSARALRRFV